MFFWRSLSAKEKESERDRKYSQYIEHAAKSFPADWLVKRAQRQNRFTLGRARVLLLPACIIYLLVIEGFGESRVPVRVCVFLDAHTKHVAPTVFIALSGLLFVRESCCVRAAENYRLRCY